MHQIGSGCASDQNRKCIRPEAGVHQTGTGSASDRNQKCIRLEPEVHQTTTGNVSDRNRDCIRPELYHTGTKSCIIPVTQMHHGGINIIEYQLLLQYQLPARALYTFQGMSLFYTKFKTKQQNVTKCTPPKKCPTNDVTSNRVAVTDDTKL